MGNDNCEHEFRFASSTLVEENEFKERKLYIFIFCTKCGEVKKVIEEV